MCPFHNEKTPSFNVNPSKLFLNVLAGGEGGDVIQFKMKNRKANFPTVLKNPEHMGIVWDVAGRDNSTNASTP